MSTTCIVTFYQTFDGINVHYHAVCDNQVIEITPGMKIEHLLKKIFHL